MVGGELMVDGGTLPVSKQGHKAATTWWPEGFLFPEGAFASRPGLRLEGFQESF
jgi:hypothetical protein